MFISPRLSLRKTFLFVAFMSLPCLSQATDFAWVEDAAPFERGALKLSVGASHYRSAPFPFSGLDGNLSEAPWVALRFNASGNAQFYLNGAIRKFIAVDRIDSALGSAELEAPVTTSQTRSATGDFSIYSKLRFPLFNDRIDFGLLTGFTMPNTNTGSGLGLDRNVVHGRMIIGHTMGQMRAVANIGIAIVDNTTGSGQDDFFTYGFASSLNMGDRVKLHGELYGIDGPPDGTDDGLFDSLNVALGISVTIGNYVTDMTTKGFFKEPSPSSAVFVRFSRTFHFGKSKEK